CVPPGNRPTPDEISTCFAFFRRELALVERPRVIVCLGAIAWSVALRWSSDLGPVPKPKPRFGHGAAFDPDDGRPGLLGAFPPSQLNTRTGRLTPPMFDRVLRRARELLELEG